MRAAGLPPTESRVPYIVVIPQSEARPFSSRERAFWYYKSEGYHVGTIRCAKCGMVGDFICDVPWSVIVARGKHACSACTNVAAFLEFTPE